MTAGPLDRRQALLVLNGLSNVGPVTIRNLAHFFDGDITAALKAPAKQLEKINGVGPRIAEAIATWHEHVNLTRLEETLAANHARFVLHEDEDYPVLLRELSDAPFGLHAQGEWDPQGLAVAIVGTRRMTLYGQATARRLARELATAGVTIVSGMARGIDAAAHEGALEAGGKTVGFLGNGLDVIYPPENIELYRAMRERGALMSEFAFGQRADRRTFPMRNRLIAGMARGVVVIESDNSGGSMITARFAGEQGREVFAVPGRIDQESSRGCHQLIREGATLIRGADDILEELDHARQRELPLGMNQSEPANAASAAEDLEGDVKTVFLALAEGERLGSDALVGRTGLTQPVVASALMMLELKRRVAKCADGTYEVRTRG